MFYLQSLLDTQSIYSSCIRAILAIALFTVVGGTAMAKQQSFTINQGQWDDQVLARTECDGATVWITRTGFVHQFVRGHMMRDEESDLAVDRQELDFYSTTVASKFIGANSNVRIQGEGLQDYYCNYFYGRDQAAWRTHVPNYDAVLLKDVYDGVDVRVYKDQGHLEYDIIAQPHADPSQVRLKHEGIQSLAIDSDGTLVASTIWGDIRENIPGVYQLGAVGRTPPTARFVIESDTSVRIDIQGSYEPSLALIVDPVLTYSTYLGGTSAEVVRGVGVGYDSTAGETRTFVAGYLSTGSFPIVNALDSTIVGSEVFVSKFSEDGSALQFSTYIGGDGQDRCWDAERGESGDIYLTGFTRSYDDFPVTLNAVDTIFNGVFIPDPFGYDGFVIRLSEEGDSLVYSTFLGGGDFERPNGIGVTPDGTALVTGETESTNFPVTLDAYQSFNAGGVSDAFMTAISSDGSQYLYSSYLGGSNSESGFDAAAYSDGEMVVVGTTNSTDFPLENAYDSTGNTIETGFIARVTFPAGALEFSTNFGGGSIARPTAVDVDTAGNIYLVGNASGGIPLVNPLSTISGAYDCFISKFSGDGQTLIYSTYLGGTDSDWPEGIEVDSDGNMHIGGDTFSSDFPLAYPFDDQLGGTRDLFYAEISADGSQLLQSTLIGGSDAEIGGYLALDDDGSAYLGGLSYSTDFPLLNEFDSVQDSLWDAVVVKIDPLLYVLGDADSSGAVSIGDAVYVINYIFGGGSSPNPLEAGDSDCSGAVSIGDAVYIVNYIFGGGPAPCY